MSYDILDEIIQTTKSKRYEENDVTVIVEYRKSHTFRIIHKIEPFSCEFLFMRFIFDDDYILIDRNFHIGGFEANALDLILLPRSNKDELVEFILSNGRIYSDEWFLSESKLKNILSKDELIRIIKDE